MCRNLASVVLQSRRRYRQLCRGDIEGPRRIPEARFVERETLEISESAARLVPRTSPSTLEFPPSTC